MNAPRRPFRAKECPLLTPARHLVFQCSLCGRRYLHARTGGCACSANNLLHGVEVDAEEFARLRASGA